MRSSFLLLICSIFNIIPSYAQDDITYPKGEFWNDSVKIGEPIQFSLTYEFPADTRLVFPDSTYNYFPFEFVEKEFFSTKQLTGSTLKDSVIYTLATYELDSVFYLRVPVFILSDGDSLRYFSEPDSVYFKAVVHEIPDQPALLAETGFQDVPQQFNYIYFIIGAVALILLFTTLGLLFGKKIYRMYIVYRLKKSFEKYEAEYLKAITHEGKSKTKDVLVVWKNYLEKLDQMPITKLTTKEIIQVYPDDSLNQALRSLDRSLYGGMQVNNIDEMFTLLKNFSQECLNHKIEEVGNG